MKKFQRIAVMVLAVVMLFTFVGCDKMPAVKKAFEKEGYEVTSGSNLVTAVFNKIITNYYAEQDRDPACTIYTAVKGLDAALIVEFNNQKELKEFYESSSNTIQGAAKDLQESDIVNGNCLIITLSSTCIEIFKNA